AEHRRTELPASEEPPPWVDEGCVLAREQRSRAGPRRDSGGRGAAEGAVRDRVRAAGRPVGNGGPAVDAGAGGAAGVARAVVAHHPPALGRGVSAGGARVREGWVRGTAAGRGGA